LLRGEPDVEQAVRNQRQAHDRQEQADILAEQPAADHARGRRVASRRSALARLHAADPRDDEQPCRLWLIGARNFPRTRIDVLAALESMTRSNRQTVACPAERGECSAVAATAGNHRLPFRAILRAAIGDRCCAVSRTLVWSPTATDLFG